MLRGSVMLARMVVALARSTTYGPASSRLVWPHESDPRWWADSSGSFVWDVDSALKIPSVSRAKDLIAGSVRQCALDAYRGVQPLPRPRLLSRPDPTRSRAWFVGVQVEDYLLHGNALSRIVERNTEGWPATVEWLPASWTAIGPDGDYEVRGPSGRSRVIPSDDVVHVRRGADRWNPARGVGVVEQHLATLDRVGLEEDYERGALTRSGVPSVAVVAPNPALSQEEADDADARWAEKFRARKPVFLPYGTTITPLGWSPADSQLVDARKMSLTDVANIFNLDSYWLGGEMKGLTYRSPGPLYLGLLRTTLEPILADFEQAWADGWLPRGQEVRFDRLQLTREDTSAAVDLLTKAIAPPQTDPSIRPLLSTEEARLYLGLPITNLAPTVTSPLDTQAGPPALPEEGPPP